MYSRRLIIVVLFSATITAFPRGTEALETAHVDAARRSLRSVIEKLVDIEPLHGRLVIFGREAEIEVSGVTEDGLEIDYDGELMEVAWEDVDDRELIGLVTPKLDELKNPAAWADTYVLFRAVGDVESAVKLANKAAKLDPKLDAAVKARRKEVFGEEPDLMKSIIGAASPKTPAAALKPRGVLGDPYPDANLKKLPTVHPRLFVRADSEPRVPGVPSLTELRRRGRTNPWSYFKTQSYGVEGILDYALWYLMFDDKQALAQAYDKVLNYRTNGTTSDGLNARDLACVYDWCYGGLTDEQRAKLVEVMHDRVDYLKRTFLDNSGAHIFHTRMNSPPYGILCVGIALKGDAPKANEYIEYARKYLWEKTFPGRKYLGGALQNGMTYGTQYIYTSVAESAMAWYAYSGENWFHKIAYEDGNWMEAQLLFAINNHQPNGLLVPLGDFAAGTLGTDHGAYISFLMPMICGTRMGEAMSFVEELHKKNGRGSVEHPETWRMFLFWDDTIPRKDWKTLPTESMFGKSSIGDWFGRTGWGNDDVIAMFRCGGNYGNHQHHDSGHFYIFRKDALALDSGSYTAGFDSPARKLYYWRSIAHNVFQFDKPGDKSDDGGERIVSEQGLSSMAEVMGNSEIKTGSILKYTPTEKYVYICGDVKPAYPGYCSKFTRHFVFIRRTGTVIIMDETAVSDRNRRMAFLLHTEHEPVKESARRYSASLAGSKLTIQTLAPRNVQYAVVGGKGKEYWNLGRNLNQPKPKYPSGNWRLEIFPPLGTTACVMINVIQSTSLSVNPPAATLKGYTVTVDGISITFHPGTTGVSVR